MDHKPDIVPSKMYAGRVSAVTIECFPEGRFLDREGVAAMEETSKESAMTMLERDLKMTPI